MDNGTNPSQQSVKSVKSLFEPTAKQREAQKLLREGRRHTLLVGGSRSGKVLRAEPVSALYEQGLVHHVGRFAVLEDQLCAFTTAGYRGEGSPDHADALVFAITDLLLNEPAAIIE